MKKLLLVLGLSVALSAPSVVSAEATWYGSLRVGVSSHDSDTKFADGGSRWGIKGSSEISDGLTAVYRFEHKIDTAKASLTGGGRLAYAGLKGGFGTITAGQIWSASYNSVGAITDNSFAYGDSETTYRHGSVVSYANSFGPASVQLDLVMDGGRDSGSKDIDQVEFGLSVKLGDIGKIAIAHVKKEDEMLGTMTYTVNALQHTMSGNVIHSPKVWAETTRSTKLTVGTASTLKVAPVMIKVRKDLTLARDPEGNLKQSYVLTTASATTTATFNGQDPDRFKNDDNVYHPSLITTTCDNLDATATDACKTETVYVSTEQLKNKEAGPEFFYFLSEDVTTTKDMNSGSKTNHIAAEFSFGGVTPYLGYSQKKMNGMMKKDKTTFVGVRGSVGDTGFGYVFQYRDKENADGTKPEPWILGLSKTMGGGASLHLEHSDPGMKNKKSTTGVWLKVDF